MPLINTKQRLTIKVEDKSKILTGFELVTFGTECLTFYHQSLHKSPIKMFIVKMMGQTGPKLKVERTQLVSFGMFFSYFKRSPAPSGM